MPQEQVFKRQAIAVEKHLIAYKMVLREIQ